MNCFESQQLLSAYIDRQLPAPEKAGVAAHAAGCAHCQEEVRSLLKLKRVLRAQPMPRLPADVTAAIEARTFKKPAPAWRQMFAIRWSSAGRRWIPPLAIAAALGGWMLGRMGKENPPQTSVQTPIAAQPKAAAGRDVIAWHPDPDASSSRKSHN